MTKTPLPSKKWLKYPLQQEKRPKLIKYNLIILENDWNTPKTKKMPTYPINLKKWLKHPYHPKNGWNTPETWKRTNIPLKPKKRPKYHWTLKKDQKTTET